MSVPDVAVTGALLAIARSDRKSVVEGESVEMVGALASSEKMEAATVAVLAMGQVAAGLMCTTMVKSWVASAASVPTLQLTVPAVLVLPALSETNLTWAGSTSATVSSADVEGPLLVTVRE